MKSVQKKTIIAILIPGLMFYACGNLGNKRSGKDAPTYHQDIASIIQTHCVPCHRPGGGGPFPLEEYQQVKRKARTIAKVIASGFMPPWPADPQYTHFLNERVLNDSQKQMIEAWVKQGCPEGNPHDVKKTKVAAYGSALGKPDLVLELEPVPLKGDRKDRFFLGKVCGTIPRDTWVRAIEFVPGAPGLVHHFNGHIINYTNRRANHERGLRLKEVVSGSYDASFPELDLFNDDGSIPERIHSAVNYLPGMSGQMLPEGLGTLRLNRRFAIVGNDLHYGPAERDTIDRSRIHLFFSKTPPQRPVYELMLGTNGVAKPQPPLFIPAGKSTIHYCRFRVNQDISLISVNPHMHLLGKSFKAYALKPNGDTVRIISIPKWDFRWQYMYTFTQLQRVPVGSEIVVEAVFDNSAQNPNNPNHPPQDVAERLEFGGASMRASDEMLQCIINWTPYQKGDEQFSLEAKRP
jgi:mono/diheme cytochrome c family protein